MATATKTPEQIIGELLASGITAEQLQQKIAEASPGSVDSAVGWVRAAKVGSLREYFGKHLKDAEGGATVTMSVADWRGLDMLLMEPPTSDRNPGGPAFDDILLDTKAAIEAKDAAKLIVNLLLIYKAVRRG